VVRKSGHLKQGVDRSKERNEGQETSDELHGGKGACGWELEDSEDEISDEKNYGCSDDLVKGILDETTKPAQKSHSIFGTMKNGTKTGPTSTQTAVAMNP